MSDATWPDLESLTVSVARQLRRRRRARMAGRLLAALAVLLLSAALLTAAWPYLNRSMNDQRLEHEAVQAADKALAFPYNTRNTMIEDAVAYNRTLAASGQPTLGVAKDPFSGGTSGDWDGDDDPQYGRLLDTDGIGTMARIRIPKISVDLRVGHGSGQTTLENGAGHLHGTSLPVGGHGTHTVITAHADYVNGSMFDRLTELKKGDPFYLQVLGRTLAYKVTSIRVTDPIEQSAGDFDALKVHGQEDEATLITCTGPGLTQRLWVTGVRNRMPDQVPYLDQAPGDQRTPIHVGLTVGTGLLAAGVTLLRVRFRPRKGGADTIPRHERDHRPRHR